MTLKYGLVLQCPKPILMYTRKQQKITSKSYNNMKEHLNQYLMFNKAAKMLNSGECLIPIEHQETTNRQESGTIGSLTQKKQECSTKKLLQLLKCKTTRRKLIKKNNTSLDCTRTLIINNLQQCLTLMISQMNRCQFCA